MILARNETERHRFLDLGANPDTCVAAGDLKEFDDVGKFLGSFGDTVEVLKGPTSVAYNQTGSELAVVDADAHNIAVFDGVTGEYSRSFGDRELGSPVSVSYQSRGMWPATSPCQPPPAAESGRSAPPSRRSSSPICVDRPVPGHLAHAR